MSTFKFSLDGVKGALDAAQRGIVLGVAARITMRTPVGNPELWKINATHHNIKNQIAALRGAPENVDAKGKLTSVGRKAIRVLKAELNASPLKKPEGYVGGHLRANWQHSINTPILTEVEGVDPSGNATVSKLSQSIYSAGAAPMHYLTNNAPYAQRIEEGHSGQAPEGMVRITLLEIPAIARQAIEAAQV